MDDNTKKPDPIDVATGHLIRLKRRAAGISQEALAEGCEVSFQQIQKYENGSNRISISRLYQIAARLGCDPADLLPDLATAQLVRQAGSDPASEWLMGRQAFDLANAVVSLPPKVGHQLLEGMIRATRSLAIVIPHDVPATVTTSVSTGDPR